MTAAIAAWEAGRYRPYDKEEIRELDDLYGEYLTLGLPMRRALTCRPADDLEWTVLLVPALTAMLDDATANFGGEWPVTAVTEAVARRVHAVEAHADEWAAGTPVSGPSLLELLACRPG